MQTKSIIVLFKNKELIDRARFVMLNEIGFSKGNDKSPDGWIYTARVTIEYYNELLTDDNVIMENPHELYPMAEETIVRNNF